MRIDRLIDTCKDIERGKILRCKGKYPYEDYVDFMVVESHHQYALLVVSGYKAALTYVVLPDESAPPEREGYAISAQWLKDNWTKWGYADCPLEDVYLISRPPPACYNDQS